MDKDKLSTQQKLGLWGSLILFLGVFAPIISIPIVGSMNYFQNGTGDGVIIIILAVVSFFLTLQKKFKSLWIPGITSLALLAYTFLNVVIRLNAVKSELATELVGNPFVGIGEALIGTVQISWGWGLLIIGAGLIIAAATFDQKEHKRKKHTKKQQKFESKTKEVVTLIIQVMGVVTIFIIVVLIMAYFASNTLVDSFGEPRDTTEKDLENSRFKTAQTAQEKIILPPKPTGKNYENTQNGVTLTITDYTFEKRSENYGILKDIEFILYNHQGSQTIYPSLLIVVVDKEDSAYTIQKEIGLGGIFIGNQDFIKERVVIDLGIGGAGNDKMIKANVLDWGRIINTVRFDTNLVEEFK